MNNKKKYYIMPLISVETLYQNTIMASSDGPGITSDLDNSIEGAHGQAKESSVSDTWDSSDEDDNY